MTWTSGGEQRRLWTSLGPAGAGAGGDGGQRTLQGGMVLVPLSACAAQGWTLAEGVLHFGHLGRPPHSPTPPVRDRCPTV